MLSMKEEGTRLLAAGQPVAAVEAFRHALNEHNRSSMKSDTVDVAVACHLNSALCGLRIADSIPLQQSDNAREVLISCDSALRLLGQLEAPSTKLRAKALYRRGLALEILGEQAGALSALDEARELLGDAEIVAAYDRVRSKLG